MEYLQYMEKEIKAGEAALVLNLVINGIPSIQKDRRWWNEKDINGFKPCYKWNTFNTIDTSIINLVKFGFKPCYKWNTFNTLDLNKNIDFMAFWFTF